MYDFIIIGAGPAGSTLARLAPPSKRILIIDRRDLESSQDTRFKKVCGGLLAPDAQKEICRQGLGIPKDILVNPQLFGVRTMDSKILTERTYQRHYFNMDREAFDRWLFSLIPARIHKRVGVVVNKIRESTSQGFEVELKSGEVFKTRQLVGADGATSIVRRWFFPHKKIPQYLSIQEWFQQDNPLSQYGALFDKESGDFYSWTISKEKHLIVGAALPLGNSSVFEQIKNILRSRGYTLGGALRREGAVINRPLRPRHLCIGKPGIYLIGEAAGWISPSSAEGISYALRSARYLAESMNGHEKKSHRCYRKKSRSLRRSIWSKWLKSPGMYWPFLRRMVLRCGFGNICGSILSKAH